MLSVLRYIFSLSHVKNYCRCNFYNKITYNLNTNVSKVCIRTIMSRVSSNFAEKLKEKDNVPKQFELIYREKTPQKFTVCFYFCNMTLVCVIIIAVLWFYLEINPNTDFIGFPLAKNNTHAIIFFTMLFFIFALCTHLCYKIPYRIYYNNNQRLYRIVSLSYNPFKMHSNEFQAGMINEHKNSLLGICGVSAEYTANRKHYIFDHENFRSSADHFKMIGEYEYPSKNDD